MKWFGESWGAPICENTEHGETPLGVGCQRCGVQITDDDRGLLIPDAGRGAEFPWEHPWHLECFMRSIGFHADGTPYRCDRQDCEHCHPERGFRCSCQRLSEEETVG